MSHAPRGWLCGGGDQFPHWDGRVCVDPFRPVDDHEVRTAVLSAIPRDNPIASGTGGSPAAAGVLGSSALRTVERGG